MEMIKLLIILCILITIIIVISILTLGRKFILENKNLHIITVITDKNNPNYKRLSNSAKLNGFDIIPLISKEPISHITGFGMKIKLVKEFLYDKNDNDIILFVDGYDVLFTCNKDEILKRYNNFEMQYGKCIVFSTENACWPDSTLSTKYPKIDTTPYKYLNSGTYIGSVKTFKDVLSKALFNINDEQLKKIDDQLFFTNLYLANSNKKIIILDHYNTIFNCISGREEDLEYHQSEKKWYNKKTQTYPLIFHGNGDSIKFLVEKIYPTI